MSAGLGDLFGGGSAGSIIEQIFFYNIVGQIVTAPLMPFFSALQQGAFELFPVVPITPQEAATAVVRGFISQQQGETYAADSGINANRFKHMVDLAGLAPAPQELAVALRRGIIPEDAGSAEGVGYVQGIRQGNLANKWSDMVNELATMQPSPADALDALLEGQIEAGLARTLYKAFGGQEIDPATKTDLFQMMFDTRGQAPTPNEALTMLNRGIITESGTGPQSTSYEQSFLEGPWRNKWLKPYTALRWYYPPPRTVTAMYNAGQMTKQQASEYLAKQGLQPDLIAMYLPDKTTSPSSPTKVLALGEIEAAYADGLLTPANAQAAIEALNYSASDAQLILQVQDFRVIVSQMRLVLSRLRSLYLSGKISATQASNGLAGLQMTPDQVSQTMSYWQLAKFDQTKDLTAAEVIGGHHYSVIDTATAISLLTGMGYTQWEAWFLLSVRNHGPIQGMAEPPRDQLNNPVGG